MNYGEMLDRDVMVEAFKLPPLPDDEYEGEGARALILFRRTLGPVLLAESVSLEDAVEYVNRDDTHGPGWFVGRDKSENWS
jgi:hypothetical protein